MKLLTVDAHEIKRMNIGNHDLHDGSSNEEI